MKIKEKMVRPGGLELPTFWFVARRSIQLSYGRTVVFLLSVYTVTRQLQLRLPLQLSGQSGRLKRFRNRILPDSLPSCDARHLSQRNRSDPSCFCRRAQARTESNYLVLSAYGATSCGSGEKREHQRWDDSWQGARGAANGARYSIGGAACPC